MSRIAEAGSVIPLRSGEPGPWLAAWIADQLRSGAARGTTLQGVSGEAMYVYGSIGVDAALTAAGDIWVGEYDFDTVEGTAASCTWRRAAPLERLGFLVIAARRFAALRGLLPGRPADATGCPACRATGDWHLFSADRKESLRIRGMICKACGGMGWTEPARG
ncbi:MAG TPA: hypothetical protein VHM31_19200 [Polyangia bacterium]|nr:hypothetical protein [Polyangia bacterium]